MSPGPRQGGGGFQGGQQGNTGQGGSNPPAIIDVTVDAQASPATVTIDAIKRVDWKIYYTDLTTYSSNDGPWTSAPQENVWLVLYRERGSDKPFTRFWLQGGAPDRTDFPTHYFFLPHLGDTYPMMSKDLPPTLIRMGLSPPSPFPDDARAWLTSESVIQHFKFGVLYSTLTESQISSLCSLAHNDPDFTVGTSPSRRAVDLIPESQEGA